MGSIIACPLCVGEGQEMIMMMMLIVLMLMLSDVASVDVHSNNGSSLISIAGRSKITLLSIESVLAIL